MNCTGLACFIVNRKTTTRQKHAIASSFLLTLCQLLSKLCLGNPGSLRNISRNILPKVIKKWLVTTTRANLETTPQPRWRPQEIGKGAKKLRTSLAESMPTTSASHAFGAKKRWRQTAHDGKPVGKDETIRKPMHHQNCFVWVNWLVHLPPDHARNCAKKMVNSNFFLCLLLAQ